MLRFDESVTELGQLQLDDAVLIGGQALNYWCEYYSQAPGLAQCGPFASKDIDFQGSRADAERCAAKLGGTLQRPNARTPTTLLAVVRFVDGNQVERQVDFLRHPFGLEPIEVFERKVRIPAQLLWVMHPLHCLMSRTSNVAGLPDTYATPHGLGQLRAAVVMVRAFVLDTATREERQARRLCQAVFKFAKTEDALNVYSEHGIDVTDAVPTHGLHDSFLEKECPRARAQVAAVRAKPRRPLRR
jgi:hypothetical protein